MSPIFSHFTRDTAAQRPGGAFCITKTSLLDGHLECCRGPVDRRCRESRFFTLRHDVLGGLTSGLERFAQPTVRHIGLRSASLPHKGATPKRRGRASIGSEPFASWRLCVMPVDVHICQSLTGRFENLPHRGRRKSHLVSERCPARGNRRREREAGSIAAADSRPAGRYSPDN